MKVVQTEARSPFEALWRELPRLKNAVCVARTAWEGGVIRDFRLLDGQYVRVTSTEGSALTYVPAEESEIYESAWRELGSRAIGKPTDNPSGIRFASGLFFELVEDRLLALD
jgi:hypothetical protein